MTILVQLVKRNMRLYLRDRASVFFSFLSVIIIIVMYFLFLGEMQIQNLEDGFTRYNMPVPEGVGWMVNSWIMSGVLMVSTITVPLGILGTLIRDRSEGLLNDFYTSPINRKILALGYLISAWIISFLMVMVNMIVGQLYVVLNGGEFLSFIDMILVISLSAGSIMVFSSMFFYVAIFMKSQNAFGLLSTLVGTFVGFLGGIYIPIGVLSRNVQNVMNVLPTSHAVVLMRTIYMRGAVEYINDFAANNATSPEELQSINAFLDNYNEVYGMIITVGDTQVSTLAMILSIVGFGLVFYILSAFKLSNSKL